MSLNNLKQELFKNKAFKNIYDSSSDIALEISENILQARLEAGLTQQELADRLQTKQSSISRLERGLSLPTLTFLVKIAAATGMRVRPPKLFSYPLLNNYKSNK